jgi:hypothetical protein
MIYFGNCGIHFCGTITIKYTRRQPLCLPAGCGPPFSARLLTFTPGALVVGSRRKQQNTAACARHHLETLSGLVPPSRYIKAAPSSAYFRRCRPRHARRLARSGIGRLDVSLWLAEVLSLNRLIGEFDSAITDTLDILADETVLHAPGLPVRHHLSIILPQELGLESIRIELVDDLICLC